jgi:hypothetical protein
MAKTKETKPLEMIHNEWREIKDADVETKLKWLKKHQKMELPYDIKWDNLIRYNETGNWPIFHKERVIEELDKDEKNLYEQIMSDDVGLTDAEESMNEQELEAML